MPYVEVDGLPLYVDRIGKGKAVVLLHDFASEGRSLRPLVWELDRTFATISVDLIGHSHSGSPRDPERYAIGRLTDDLVALLRLMGHERAAWFGFGFGARIALEVAVRHPEATWAVVLEGAACPPGTVEEHATERAARAALAERIDRGGIEVYEAEVEAEPWWRGLAARLPAETLDEVRRERLSHREAGLVAVLRGLDAGEAPADLAAAAQAPALVVTGDLDGDWLDASRALSARLPNGRLAVVSDTGRAVHLERHEALGALVREFLDEVQSASPR